VSATGPLRRPASRIDAMRRMLVVDDDHDTLDSLKLLLESYYEICLAENGAQALLEMERGFHPDVILLDLTMPVMGGADMLRETKRLDMRIPVIIISAHPEAEKIARELGVEEVIPKPFTYEQLKKKIDRAVKGPGSRSGSRRGGSEFFAVMLLGSGLVG
jgi:CheY-like chemotaxis protein